MTVECRKSGANVTRCRSARNWQRRSGCTSRRNCRACVQGRPLHGPDDPAGSGSGADRQHDRRRESQAGVSQLLHIFGVTSKRCQKRSRISVLPSNRNDASERSSSSDEGPRRSTQGAKAHRRSGSKDGIPRVVFCGVVATRGGGGAIALEKIEVGGLPLEADRCARARHGTALVDGDPQDSWLAAPSQDCLSRARFSAEGKPYGSSSVGTGRPSRIASASSRYSSALSSRPHASYTSTNICAMSSGCA